MRAGAILPPMRSDAFDTPEIQPAEAKLILALVLSLALHLALAFLVQVKPEIRPEARPETRIKALQVDLAERRVAASPQTSETHSSAPPPESDRPATPEPAPAASAPPAAAPAQAAPPPPSPLPAIDIPLVEDPTYYTAKQVDVHPAATKPIRPEFPDVVAEAGVEGFVTLRLLIDDAGVVREISVVEAQPPETFEAAAMDAFRNARFSPAQRNGRPVKSDVLIKVTFELVNRGKK